MTTDIGYFYFDASDDAVSDPDSNWSNDANLFDASVASFAAASAASTKDSKYLKAGGTNAPADLLIPITQVRTRIRAYTWGPGSPTASATVYTDGEAEELGTVVLTQTGDVFYSNWTTLTPPADGWTWAEVAALEVRIYMDMAGWFYAIQLEVTFDTTYAYYFDASDDAVSDPDNKWINEDKIVDSDYSDDLYGYTSTAGSTSSNFVFAGGTNAPASGGSVTQVCARTRSLPAGSGTDLETAIYSDSLAELLGTVVDVGDHGSIATTKWIVLNAPSGGWTWEKVSALEFKGYQTGGGTSYLIWVQIYVVGTAGATGSPWYAYAQQ